MKSFLADDFLLESAAARRLYFDYAKEMPVIDYHNHLPPDQIAGNRGFENITQAWIAGDHYKWRAMRSNGIAERYCTGDASDWEKFQQWAATVPYTLRNPLYHWTHLELRRYFGIQELLNPGSAQKVYHQCNELLATADFKVRRLLERMNVRVICTTDDPIDSLVHHQQIRSEQWPVKVLPAFRPDKVLQVAQPATFNAYLDRLAAVSDTAIVRYPDLLDALKKRHDYFATQGASVADHGLEAIPAEDYTEQEIHKLFDRLRAGEPISPIEIRKFQAALLEYFAVLNWEKGWVQQFHLGALRNNNSRMLQQLGPDTGWDSIGDFPQAVSLARFLDRLDRENKLTKTIIYNLNPADNAILASMLGNFNDGSVAGKIQWGSAWWFLDQKEGMVQQLNTLSSMGLLSRFVGMLTDSRSFLSFPRHEYFRRILCNLLGNEMKAGELPGDFSWVGSLVADICYTNAARYFNWEKGVSQVP